MATRIILALLIFGVLIFVGDYFMSHSDDPRATALMEKTLTMRLDFMRSIRDEMQKTNDQFEKGKKS